MKTYEVIQNALDAAIEIFEVAQELHPAGDNRDKPGIKNKLFGGRVHFIIDNFVAGLDYSDADDEIPSATDGAVALRMAKAVLFIETKKQEKSNATND